MGVLAPPRFALDHELDLVVFFLGAASGAHTGAAFFLADSRRQSYYSPCRALRLTESAGRHPNVGVFRPVCVSRVASVSVGHLTRLARFLSASNACSTFGRAVFTLPALIRRRKPSSRHLAQALLSLHPVRVHVCVVLGGGVRFGDRRRPFASRPQTRPHWPSAHTGGRVFSKPPPSVCPA
jgi:hypothetical protein